MWVTTSTSLAVVSVNCWTSHGYCTPSGYWNGSEDCRLPCELSVTIIRAAPWLYA